jgi:hypothetical protein
VVQRDIDAHLAEPMFAGLRVHVLRDQQRHTRKRRPCNRARWSTGWQRTLDRRLEDPVVAPTPSGAARLGSSGQRYIHGAATSPQTADSRCGYGMVGAHSTAHLDALTAEVRSASCRPTGRLAAATTRRPVLHRHTPTDRPPGD